MASTHILAFFLLTSLQYGGDNSTLFDDDIDPMCVLLSRDGTRIAVSGGAQKGGDWKVFNLTNGKCEVNGMEGNLRSWGAWAVSLSHDNSLVAVGGNRSNLFLATKRTGELFWNLTDAGHLGVIQNLFFTPDDKYLISTGGDMMIRVWDVERKKVHAVFRLTSTNPRLNQWQNAEHKEDAKLVFDVKGKYHVIGSCALSPDGANLAIAGNVEGRVPLLDFSKGNVLKSIAIKQPVAGSVQFTRDGKWLLVAACEINGEKGTVEIWDLEKNILVKSIFTDGSIHFAISPDKKSLISGGADGFRLYDVSTGNERFSYFTKADPRLPREKVYPDGSKKVQKQCRSAGVGFLPDGKTLYYVPAGWIRTEIYFHDTETGRPVDFRERVRGLPKAQANKSNN